MKSILFSLFQHFRTLSLIDAFRDCFKALRGICRGLRYRSGDSKLLAERRTSQCQQCEFYDEKWKTCGTPGETMKDDAGPRVKIGCWCYLPLANRDPAKDCWARSHDLVNDDGAVGWK